MTRACQRLQAHRSRHWVQRVGTGTKGNRSASTFSLRCLEGGLVVCLFGPVMSSELSSHQTRPWEALPVFGLPVGNLKGPEAEPSCKKISLFWDLPFGY